MMYYFVRILGLRIADCFVLSYSSSGGVGFSGLMAAAFEAFKLRHAVRSRR
jgi:hypothetical protein